MNVNMNGMDPIGYNVIQNETNKVVEIAHDKNQKDHLLDFEELSRFRQLFELEEKGLNLHFYTSIKETVNVYRGIFGVLSIFFLVVAFFAYKSTPSILSQHLLENTHLLKNCFVGFSLGLGVITGLIGFTMNGEVEAMRHLLSRSKVKLKHIYDHDKAALGRWYVLFFANCKEYFKLRHELHETEDKFDKLKHDFIHLVRKIRKSKNYTSKERHVLYHQSLIELSYNLNYVIKEFKDRHNPTNS